MASDPRPKGRIEREWKKIALLVAERIGIRDLNEQLHTTQVLQEIESSNNTIYQIMNEYLEAYKNYVAFIKDINENTIDQYFKLEDIMNEKKEELYRHLNLYQ